jgi:hypothetical protein
LINAKRFENKKENIKVLINTNQAHLLYYLIITHTYPSLSTSLGTGTAKENKKAGKINVN